MTPAAILQGCGGGEQEPEQTNAENALTPDDSAASGPAANKQSVSDQPYKPRKMERFLFVESPKPLPRGVPRQVKYRYFDYGAIQVDLNEFARRLMDKYFLTEIDADSQEIYRMWCDFDASPVALVDDHLDEFYPELETASRKAKRKELLGVVEGLIKTRSLVILAEQYNSTHETVRIIGKWGNTFQTDSEIAAARARTRYKDAVELDVSIQRRREQIIEEKYPQLVSEGWHPRGAAMLSLLLVNRITPRTLKQSDDEILESLASDHDRMIWYIIMHHLGDKQYRYLTNAGPGGNSSALLYGSNRREVLTEMIEEQLLKNPEARKAIGQ